MLNLYSNEAKLFFCASYVTKNIFCVASSVTTAYAIVYLTDRRSPHNNLIFLNTPLSSSASGGSYHRIYYLIYFSNLFIYTAVVVTPGRYILRLKNAPPIACAVRVRVRSPTAAYLAWSDSVVNDYTSHMPVYGR